LKVPSFRKVAWLLPRNLVFEVSQECFFVPVALSLYLAQDQDNLPCSPLGMGLLLGALILRILSFEVQLNQRGFLFTLSWPLDTLPLAPGHPNQNSGLPRWPSILKAKASFSIPRQPSGERVVFSADSARTAGCPLLELDSSTSYTKINQKWIKHLTVRTKTIRLLEK